MGPADAPIVPPPWSLSGRGYLLLLAPRRNEGGLPRGLHRSRRSGGFGALMIVEYLSSTVGPYREILYIPHGATARCRSSARERAHLLRGHSISRIYVTSEVSRRSGAANWGIPKELGRITWRCSSPKLESILLEDRSGLPLLRVEIARRCALLPACSLPFSSRLLPHTLIQRTPRGVLRTRIAVEGRARLAGRARMESLSPRCAGLASRRILLAFRIPRALLRFPDGERLPVAHEG